MNKIKEVIVVEGKNDTKRLKEFFEVDTIETHGLGINKETLEFIKAINEKRGVILLLDPDTPGEKIRRRINDYIPCLKNAFVFKEDAKTKKKVGIEHASYDVISKALENIITYKDEDTSISLEDYISLGYMGKNDSSIKRDIVQKRYHLGKCNSKTLYKRLNMLGIKKEDLI